MVEDGTTSFSLSEDVPLEEIVDLTCRLMEFHTTPGNGKELTACRSFISDWCEKEGLHPQSQDHAKECSLYLGPNSAKAPLLIFSHFDVAEAHENLFNPFICGDQLYGRGAIDDKYAVALSLILYREACHMVRSHGGTGDDVPLMLVLSGVEEQEGASTTFSLLQNLRPEFCIALDGGCADGIVTMTKGILQVEVQSLGIAADGAHPWMGKNAVDALLGDYIALSAYFQNKRIDTAPDHWYPTMNLGMLHAGSMVTQVPDKASAFLDIRYTEHENPDTLYEELCHVVGGAMVLRYKEPIFRSLPSPWQDELFRLTGAHMKRGQGSGSGRFFSRMEVSAVIWGADGDGSMHSTSEHLCIPSIIPVWQGLVRLLNAAFSKHRQRVIS